MSSPVASNLSFGPSQNGQPRVSSDLGNVKPDRNEDEPWQRGLRSAIRDPDDLVSRLSLPEQFLDGARRSAQLFPLLVPLSYIERIEKGNVNDPLLRQVLPLIEEGQVVEGFQQDAVGDLPSRRAPGLLHKYAGRALLVVTGACAVHCRYCFRRHYPYGDEPKRLIDWQPAWEEIASDTTITELILSGGDPLMLTDRRLEEFVAHFDSISHLKRLRIHTRLPIVLPERVTARFVHWMQNLRMTPFVVVHANHPREIVTDCASRLRMLVRSGITILNQAVLLRGINDDEDVLIALSERLINLGVLPYYLHQLDRVTGASHFEVPLDEGRRLLSRMRSKLPGYAVPDYVQEIASEAHKVPIQ